MEENHKLALIIALYISKFDRKALENLGYKTFEKAFESIGNELDVKPSTIRRMMNQFDPYFQNSRVGYYQRKLIKSRVDIMEKFGHLEELEFDLIVKDILNNKNIKSDLNNIYTELIVDKNDNKEYNKKTFTTRCITGNKAEKIFIEYYNRSLINKYKGNLKDTTAFGCGYDFEIENGEYKGCVFEVKGCMEKECRQILLTEKEWKIATELKDKYNIVIVSNLQDENYVVNIYNNPSETANPKPNIQQKISVNWQISPNELNKIEEKLEMAEA